MPRIITDTFTGDDATDIVSHTLDTGEAWMYPPVYSESSGDLHLLGNKLACANWTFRTALVDAVAPDNIQIVEGDFTFANFFTRNIGICARSNNDPSSGAYDDVTAGWYPGGGWYIHTYQWGDIADDAITNQPSDGVTYHLKLVTDDTIATLYVDGLQILTANYATHFTGADGGYVGIILGEDAGADHTVADNFQATFTSPAPPFELPASLWDVRAYTTSNDSDVRVYLPVDWITQVNFEITERGGFGEGSLRIMAPWSALPGIIGSERIDVWLWNVLVYRGWLTVHERAIDNPEEFAPQLAGLIEILNRTTIDRRYAYSQPQDVARIWGDIVTDYCSGLGVVNESQDIGATLQLFDARDSSLAEAFNRLVDQSPGSAIWGHDTTSDYSSRLYLRPRPTATSKRLSIGGEVQGYAHPYDTGAVRNVLRLRGGNVAQENLLHNGSFEETQPASEDHGNMLIEPSFEDNNSGGYWTLSAGTTIQFPGNGGAHGSARNGDHWLEIDQNGEYAEQKVPIVPTGYYMASCWARLEDGTQPNSFLLELEGLDALNNLVTLSYAGFNSATTPALDSEIYRRFTVEQDWSAYPTVTQARFRVTAQGGTATNDGVLVEDCGVFRVGAAQEDWRAHPTGSATMIDVDWASRDVTPYHGGNCVKLLAGNIGGSPDTLELYQPLSGWVQVAPNERYTLLCFWQVDGLGNPSDNALSIGVSQRKSDHTAGTNIESSTATGNPSTWTMIWVDIQTAADTALLQAFIRSRTARPLYVDAVMLVKGGIPPDLLTGSYWPAGIYERVWTVENINTSAPGRAPGVLSAEASTSIATWGRRETVVQNDQIVDEATGQAFAIGWFNAHAVPQVQAALHLTATRSEDLIFPNGLIRLLNLPSAPDALFPSRIRYTIDGEGVEIDVDLGSQRPELVEMLRVIAGKRNSGELPAL